MPGTSRSCADECFRALRASKDTFRKEILFVDNGSVDGTPDYVAEHFPEVTLIRSPTNLGFIRANNLAYRQARGKYILMLNSDAFVSENTLQETVDYMRQHPETGVVGARLVGRDGVLQPSARYFPTPLKMFLNQVGLLSKVPFLGPLDDLTWDHKSVRDCDWVVGCYLLARKDLVDATGFFLREDFFMYNDDNDLCLRIKRMGYRVTFYPVDCIHLGGANMKKAGMAAKKNRASRKVANREPGDLLPQELQLAHRHLESVPDGAVRRSDADQEAPGHEAGAVVQGVARSHGTRLVDPCQDQIRQHGDSLGSHKAGSLDRADDDVSDLVSLHVSSARQSSSIARFPAPIRSAGYYTNGPSMWHRSGTRSMDSRRVGTRSASFRDRIPQLSQNVRLAQ